MLKIVTAVLLVTIIVGAGSAPPPVSAATPTPTPTLRPLYPTATSLYGGLRITPTPYSIHPEDIPAYFDTSSQAGTFADTVINMYRVINFSGAADFVLFMVMVLVIVMYLVHLANDKDR